SAASGDPLKLPLTEVWSWITPAAEKHTPLFHSVVWKDRVFFVAREGGKRQLMCANAKTGKILWRQQLESPQLKFPLSDIAGPAVSQSGIVFIYDWMTERRGRQGHAGQGTQSSGAVEAVNSFCVRTFRALDGQEGPFFPLAAMGANGVLPRVSLL